MREQLRDDRAFSLVEVVLAMLLFAVLALAILPLMTGVTQLTAGNRDSVVANTAAKQKIASIHRRFPADPSIQVDPAWPVGKTDDCSSLPSSPGLTESIGSGLTLRTSAGACPTSFPGTVPVRITVTDGGGATVASVDTSFRVTQ